MNVFSIIDREEEIEIEIVPSYYSGSYSSSGSGIECTTIETDCFQLPPPLSSNNNSSSSTPFELPLTMPSSASKSPTTTIHHDKSNNLSESISFSSAPSSSFTSTIMDGSDSYLGNTTTTTTAAINNETTPTCATKGAQESFTSSNNNDSTVTATTATATMSESSTNNNNNDNDNDEPKKKDKKSNHSTTTQPSSSSLEEGTTTTGEYSRRLVEYFVIVSSVPRMVPKSGSGTTTGPNNNNNREKNNGEFVRKDSTSGGNTSTAAAAAAADGLHKVKESYSKGGNYTNDHDDNLHDGDGDDDDCSVKSMRASCPPPPPPPPPLLEFSKERMNPRTYARMESRWVHLEEGTMGGSASVAAMDGDVEEQYPPHQQQHQQKEEGEDAATGLGKRSSSGSGPKIYPETDEFNNNTAPGNDSSFDDAVLAPPSPMVSPAASISNGSIFTTNDGNSTTASTDNSSSHRLRKDNNKMKKHNLFRTMSDRKNIISLNKNGLRNVEKKLESKLKAMKIRMTSSAVKEEGGHHHHHQQQQQQQHHGGSGDADENNKEDYQSDSSCSSLSESNVGDTMPTNNNRVLVVDTSGASTFRPSQTPTSVRKVPPPPPMTPPGSTFPRTPTSMGGNGASENIRMGQKPDFRDREYNDDIDDCVLEPVITAQYPPVDHPESPLNPMLPQFCHPRGIDYIVPSHEYKMPSIHYFVLTDAKGGKLYHTCLTVYEEFKLQDVMEQEDDISLPSVRSEGQERSRVECSIDDSPKVVRPRRRSKNHTYYAPRVLCLVSTWPYLSAFRTYLTQLYRLATTTNLMTAPLERYVLNICSEVPAPPPGAFEVRLSILDSNIRFWAPPADQPIPYVSLPYGILFECLDIGNILFAWYSLACERKILLVSGQLSLLTVCAEILCSMLFPMRWSHLYIPVLPRFLSPMLDAPMPYLCGISRENFPYAVGDISDETVVVDLDRNIITMGPQTPELPDIPHKRKVKLEAALEKRAGDVFWKARGLTKAEVDNARLSGDEDLLAELLGMADGVWDEKIRTLDDAFSLAHAPDSVSLLYDEKDVISSDSDRKQSRWDAVQEAFLRFYVAMLKDYRKYLPTSSTDSRSSWRGPGGVDGGRFLVEDFMRVQRPDFQPFLEELIGTQQFDDFISRRMYNAGNAPDVTFFDQSIDAKRNRSKLKLKKVDTPFLNSANAHRDLKCIDAIEPNKSNIPSPNILCNSAAYTYPTWPESFDESLFGRARPIPKIIATEFDRRSALAAMLRAKHGLAVEERQSGGSNRSPEATAFVLFFVAFSQIIGKEWVALGVQHTAMGDNMLDEDEDLRYRPSSSSVNGADSSPSGGRWKPKVNPPWMAGENFQSLHTNLRPDENKEEVFNDITPSNGFFATDCNNVCSDCDLGKAIDPSTFIGIPWGSNNIAPATETSTQSHSNSDQVCSSPNSAQLGNELEKARAIAKAQVDLGFNTLKMMRMRKVPPEPIAYKTLIEACGRCGITHRAAQLMEMMTQDGLAVDSEIYFCFMSAFSNAEGGAIIPYHQAQEPSVSEISASLPSESDCRSSKGDDRSTGSKSLRKDAARGFNGFYTAMSSVGNKRALKMANMKQMKSFFKQGLTKKKNLVVNKSIKIQLDLSHCILEDLYPGLVVDAESDACPKCSCVLSQDNIIVGWKPCDAKDYSTACPSCKHRFVPKFSVSCDLDTFEGSQGKGTTLYCDYLSPWVLLREIRGLITKPTSSKQGKAAKVLGVEQHGDDNEQGGIKTIIDPAFREGSDINATLWWNLIVTFARFKIPFTFLLQGSYEDQQLIMPTLEDM